MIDGIRAAHQAIGSGSKRLLTPEREHGRRDGLWLAQDTTEGMIITSAMLNSTRPAHGVKTRHLAAVLGARMRRDVAAGQPLSWDDVDLS